MSYTTREDWHLWLCDKDIKPVRKLVDAIKWSAMIGCFGMGNFTVSLPYKSASRSYLNPDEEQFIFAQRRDKGMLFMMDRLAIKRDPCELSGTTIEQSLAYRIIHGDTPDFGPLAYNSNIDNVMKDFVRTAAELGNVFVGPDGNARQIPRLTVAADTSSCPTSKEITQHGMTLFDLLVLLGVTYDVDFWLEPTFAHGGCTMEFRTGYPLRGTDRTRTNGAIPPTILTDIIRVVKKGESYRDSTPYRNVAYRTDMKAAEVSGDYASFWRREIRVESGQTESLVQLLATQFVRIEGYQFSFRETSRCQVATSGNGNFWPGDEVSYGNSELGVAEADDIVKAVEFRIDGPNEEIILTLGDPKPDLSNLTKRRGRTSYILDDPSWYAWGLQDHDGDIAEPDPADNTIQLAEGTGIDVNKTAATVITISAVEGGACYWERGDLDSGAGSVIGLHTKHTGDPVIIGADSADLSATPWVGTSGGTKLDVRGLLRVTRGVYANENSLALWGIDGGVPKVHIVDESTAVGGAGGGACVLDIYNADVRHHMFDANIANASYVRGIFKIHDATGAIGHSFNAITGAAIFNEQGLGTGDFRWGSDTNPNALFLDATGVGTVELWGGASFEVFSDGAVTLEMSIDGSTGVVTWTGAGTIGKDGNDLRIASIVDDIILDSASAIWLRTSGDTRWYVSDTAFWPAIDDSYDIGLVTTHRIRNIFSILGTFEGDVTIANAAGIINTGRVVNRFVLISNGTRFQGRALVAADLGGHVHVNTFEAVTSGAGTAHTHAMSGNTGAGTNHVHGYYAVVNWHAAGYSGDVVTSNWTAVTPVTYTLRITDVGGTPRYVYIADNDAGLDARWEYMYVPTSPHTHEVSYKGIASAGEAAHTHPVGTIAAANEGAHTHQYDKTVTPTQGPS